MALKTAADVKSWLVDNGFEKYASTFYGKRSQTISLALLIVSLHYRGNYNVLINHFTIK